MGGINKAGGSYDVHTPQHAGKASSPESIGNHKGKKVSKSKNPFKFIVKAFTSPFKKSDKAMTQRSISLPNLTDESHFVSSGIRKSSSLENFKASEPVLNSYKPLTEETRIPDPVYSGPSVGGKRRFNPEATANNIIKQLDVLESSSKAGAKEPLDPKSLAVLFKEVLTKPLAADKILEFSKMLATEGRDIRQHVHDKMKTDADTLVDEVLQHYPNIAGRLSREDCQAISRDVQASAFKKMSVDVWSTTGADDFAESAEADFLQQASWALKPNMVIKPKPKDITQTNFTPRQENTRKAAGVKAEPKQVNLSQTEKNNKAKPLQQREVTTATLQTLKETSSRVVQTAVPETKTTVTGSSRPAKTDQPATTGAIATTNETPVQKTGSEQQSDSVVQKDGDITQQFQQALQSSKEFVKNELTARLPADQAKLAYNAYRQIKVTGVSDDQARSAALLFTDSITKHGLSKDQALTVVVETSNWLNDEADYAPDLVLSAGQGLIDWLKAGEPEGAAVAAMTEWLEDESWEDRIDTDDPADDISTTSAGEQPDASTVSLTDNSQQSAQVSGTDNSIPPAPPPPPLPQNNITTEPEVETTKPSKQTKTTTDEAGQTASKPDAEDPRSALMAAIRDGKTLRKVDTAEPKQVGAKDALMAAIREGKTLKKVDTSEKERKSQKPQEQPEGMEGILDRRIKKELLAPAEELAAKLTQQISDFKYDFDESDASKLSDMRSQLLGTLKESGFRSVFSAAPEETINKFLGDMIDFDGSEKDMQNAIESWITGQD
ncbi:hypothetical protein M3P05_04850 [Sansalvadorimonas sp. 2012CJ34-2]|uniref:WH2 domain-containing protein n=1 Tax=Parendozoicomonas callyspongiae TaxID=2942213 RepID=A0ABT0PD91_9GAMM|nr:WH2 domain-containing protein [Sansalvadorimonas sp. 2012CJ34-2]MCL6269273.1 hypothetical protein [Sansalvadorimonas sp. 2012CJ34-2]